MGKQIGYAIGGLIILLTLIGLFLPSTGRVERSIDIEAPAATVYALLTDFDLINEWSPWLDADPNARIEVSGPQQGIGATLEWEGVIIGSGRQTIVEATPYSRVVSELQLDDDELAYGTIELLANDRGTVVTWQFTNEFGFNLPGRYFGLLLDRIVGDAYDTGLDKLKALAESLPPADFSTVDIERLNVESQSIVFLTATSAPEATAIAEALGDAYFELLNFIDSYGLTAAGSPMSIGASLHGGELRFRPAIPVTGRGDDLPTVDGEIRIGISHGGPVLRASHRGSYRNLAATHDKVAAYLAVHRLRRSGESWEAYVSDPTRVREDELLTYVYYPIDVPAD